MKKLTVGDILKMPEMSGCRVVAGIEGLDNEVGNPNVADNMLDEKGFNNFDVRKDFFITSFYFGLNNPEYIVNTLSEFSKAGVSAVCIADTYIKNIPDQAKQICDKYALPVIFVDEYTSYSSIISGIISLKIAISNSALISNLLDELTSPKISTARKSEIINDLNHNFWNTAIVFFATDNYHNNSTKKKNSDILQMIHYLQVPVNCLASEFREGLLYIFTYRDSNFLRLSDTKSEIVSKIKDIYSDAIVGVSNPIPTQKVGDGILQAFTAVYSGANNQENIIYYSDLGITRLLVSIQDHPALETFYEETISPILEYDLKYSTNLFNTFITFVENEMDYQKTSDYLFVHKNTVRYRISKIRELMNFGKSEMDFFETLSIVYKIYKMKN